MEHHFYRAHGIAITSEVELALHPAPPDCGPPDMELRWGPERPVPAADPPGALLARLEGPEGRLRYVLARDRDCAVLRYPGLCDFVGDPQLRTVTAHLHPGSDPDLVPVLAAGALLAVHLKLRHELVLHASAVHRGDGALAFVGASGMGKSTLAALLCASGHRLLTDDVLRVDLAGDSAVRVHPGSTESRLRPAARELADAAPAGAVRPTADGRLAVRLSADADESVPLAACIVPLPDRAAEVVAVRRLPPPRALLRMVRFPRLVGWLEPMSTAHEFQSLADLVERVPVLEASVPWGPPFRPEIAAELVREIASAVRQKP